MVLQSSGAISLSNIQTEFGGTNPISISEYYGVASGVPVSGTIAFSNFYGKSAGGGGSPGRGVVGGGVAASAVNVIEYITIATTGNTTDFGDLTASTGRVASCSSSTRGIFAGGERTVTNSGVNNIEYITIATTGNAIDFGDLTVARLYPAGCSSDTRGIFGGGSQDVITYLNTIDYVTIATTGNAIDFGDLITIGTTGINATSSPTRGVFAGLSTPNSNSINYVTIATTGNAVDFGDLPSTNGGGSMACSSPTRGLLTQTPNTISYVTIATTGNATSFGSLTFSRNRGGATSNSSRGVFFGGIGITPAPSLVNQNIIDYVTIATTGNATDFGDLSATRRDFAGCSNSHGGLSGGGGGGGTGRGLFGGGIAYPAPVTTNYYNVVDYVTIATTGNATDFGDLTVIRFALGACSSSTRGVFAAGGAGAPAVPVNTIYNTIDYVTIATTGNATDFGDLTVSRQAASGCSSPTRGLFAAGNSGSPLFTQYNIIDYITIATTGNATDFGDLSVARSGVAALSSPTRGVFGGGISNVIEYVTIATIGNTTDFGDLTILRSLSGCSSPTRGVFGGGNANTPGTTYYNTIDYITIATIGNAIDFGDLTESKTGTGACSSPTRGIFGGGYVNFPANITYNTIEYITIATTGNTTDFGDLSVVRGPGACSDSHGGLA